MDALQRTFYRMALRVAFLGKKGKEFQQWFQQLARHAWGPDFEPVRPHGAEGDWKADGRRESDSSIYQCYAPETIRAARLESKIENDFEGALRHWGDRMERWIFVHNQEDGLPPGAVNLLLGLRRANPDLEIEDWSLTELSTIADALDLAQCEHLFGTLPTADDYDGVGSADVARVIRHLETVEPSPGEEPVSPPSVDKIRRNSLSNEVLDLLVVGKRKEPLVEKYFRKHSTPAFGERVAEGFRRRYRALKETERSSDGIFLGLQRYMGSRGKPKKQIATLAVLAYLFDRCDIFEDPEGDAPGSGS